MVYETYLAKQKIFMDFLFLLQKQVFSRRLDLTYRQMRSIIRKNIIRILITNKEGTHLESLHYLLMKAHTRMHRRIRARAAELRLTSGQPKNLEYLLQYGESNQKTIADYCEIEQATVGSILSRMETAGLVTRSQHEGNRRSLYVTLTADGRAAAERMEHIFVHEEADVSAALTKEEQIQLRRLLEKLCRGAAKEGDLL